MCGGDLEITEGMTVCECEYCGSRQTVPSVDNEKKVNLFTRANRLRAACEFDKAAGVYESIVTEFQEEAEAYWGLVLCKFGIEYVDDPKTGKKIPTCHRSSFDSVLEDSDFEMVMEYSDTLSRSVYREEAKAIEDLRVGIIEVSSKEDPYDIFICYKETDPNGERTIDSVIAQDVYDALTDKGYRVFFSRITLEDKLGQEYEPYIFAALNSAKVMLAFGTDYEYYNAVWVKNEWSRFLSLIENGQKKTLIPCYKGIDAYDMPAEFKRLQAQDMGKVGAIQDLIRGIGKILGSEKTQTVVQVQGSSTPGALTVRGNLSLEDGDFQAAYDYFERSLDDNPADSKAYLGKMLANFKLKSLEEFKNVEFLVDLDKIPDFKHALQFSVGADKDELQEVYDTFEKKAQIRYFMQTIKKYSKKKEKEEILAAQEAERKRLEEERLRKEEEARLEQQRREEEARRESLRKQAFDEAVAQRNAKIEEEVKSVEATLNAEASSKKQPIIANMTAKMQDISSERNRIKDQISDLTRQRAGLGLFKGKKKAEITSQIAVLDSRLSALPSDDDIRKEFKPQLDAIEREVSNKIAAEREQIGAKYPMPKIEDITINE